MHIMSTERTLEPIDVVGAIIIRDNSVLAAKRGPGKALEGMWEFPGGKIEPGESPASALKREIWEELGCHISVGSRVHTFTHEYDFGAIALHTYYADLIEREPSPSEHAELRWVHVTQLRTLAWAPADIPAVDTVMRHFSALLENPT